MRFLAPSPGPWAQVPGSSWKSQKEAQEDQRVKEIGGPPNLFQGPLVLLGFLLAPPWAPCNFVLGGTFKIEKAKAFEKRFRRPLKGPY